MRAPKLLVLAVCLAVFCAAPSARAAGRQVAVVAGPKGGTLGALSLPLTEGYEARIVKGETVCGKQGAKPVLGISLVSMKGAAGGAFAAALMRRRSGENLTPYGDGVFAFEPGGKSGDPISIFIVANEEADTALLLSFYDESPAGGDLLKRAEASTPALRDMVDLVVLSPAEREEKAKAEKKE